jgi:hypothetical protein
MGANEGRLKFEQSEEEKRSARPNEEMGIRRILRVRSIRLFGMRLCLPHWEEALLTAFAGIFIRVDFGWNGE